MPVVTRYATNLSALSADDGVESSNAVPGLGDRTVIGSGFGFDGVLPSDAIINSVVLEAEYRANLSNALYTSLEGYVGTTQVGAVSDGPIGTLASVRSVSLSITSRSQLLDGTLSANITVSNSNAQSRTLYTDFIRITVDYTVPINLSGTCTISTSTSVGLQAGSAVNLTATAATVSTVATVGLQAGPLINLAGTSTLNTSAVVSTNPDRSLSGLCSLSTASYVGLQAGPLIQLTATASQFTTNSAVNVVIGASAALRGTSTLTMSSFVGLNPDRSLAGTCAPSTQSYVGLQVGPLTQLTATASQITTNSFVNVVTGSSVALQGTASLTTTATVAMNLDRVLAGTCNPVMTGTVALNPDRVLAGTCSLATSVTVGVTIGPSVPLTGSSQWSTTWYLNTVLGASVPLSGTCALALAASLTLNQNYQGAGTCSIQTISAVNLVIGPSVSLAGTSGILTSLTVNVVLGAYIPLSATRSEWSTVSSVALNNDHALSGACNCLLIAGVNLNPDLPLSGTCDPYTIFDVNLTVSGGFSLTTFYLNSKSNVVQLELVELSHPSFSQVYRIVRNKSDGVTVTLETGSSFLFSYYPVRVSMMDVREGLSTGLQLDFGDLGDVLPKELDYVLASGGYGIKPLLRYRTYRSDMLTFPLYGPLLLQVEDISFNKYGATLKALAPQANANRTGEIYDLNRFPMLRGFA